MTYISYHTVRERPTIYIRRVNDLHFTYDLYSRRFLADDDDGAWVGDM